MEPTGVVRGQKLVYSNSSPGASVGCSPTTPGPCTRWVSPLPSMMIHSRLTSCAVSCPTFEIVTW